MKPECDPYISISAVTDAAHIDPLIAQFSEQEPTASNHRGVLAYLAHNGTHLGQPHPIAKFTPRSIDSADHLIRLTRAVGNRAVNALHMDCVNYDHAQVDSLHSVEATPCHPVTPAVKDLLSVPYQEGTCRLLQINGHVELDDLDALLQLMPELRVILAIGPHVSKHGTPAALSYIGERRKHIKDVLPDLSVGQGTVIRPKEAGEQMRDIMHAFPGLGVGIAGGLGPANVEELVRIVRAASGVDAFSVDAESSLRNRSNALDLGLANEYIAATVRGFRDTSPV